MLRFVAACSRPGAHQEDELPVRERSACKRLSFGLSLCWPCSFWPNFVQSLARAPSSGLAAFQARIGAQLSRRVQRELAGERRKGATEEEALFGRQPSGESQSGERARYRKRGRKEARRRCSLKARERRAKIDCTEQLETGETVSSVPRGLSGCALQCARHIRSQTSEQVTSFGGELPVRVASASCERELQAQVPSASSKREL